MTVSFNSFEETNDFAKLKDGQIFKVKNSWKVRIRERNEQRRTCKKIKC